MCLDPIVIEGFEANNNNNNMQGEAVHNDNIITLKTNWS